MKEWAGLVGKLVVIIVEKGRYGVKWAEYVGLKAPSISTTMGVRISLSKNYTSTRLSE